MNITASDDQDDQRTLHQLTEAWGTRAAVSLYLERCQVDTPDHIVGQVWQHIHDRRRGTVGEVVDFGAGDGRFANDQRYRQYRGYEIDPRRCPLASLPKRASLLYRCAFSDRIDDADVCIGNPPYVRNQDLPAGWRQTVAESLVGRTGVEISGLANAWQYFFLLGLASTKPDGLAALVIPYEWVSRPSARSLREFIKRHQWEVSIYRLRDKTFDRVLTTSSITVVDKRSCSGRWRYFEERQEGGFRTLPSPTASVTGVIKYLKRSRMERPRIFAKRGLSPGTQRVLVLTEGERVRSGLRVHSDVVPCITSLRHLDPSCTGITSRVFERDFRLRGHKCWLINTDRRPSTRLSGYLSSIPESDYHTATCLNRESWWRFVMPDVPALLVATGFRGDRPKIAINYVNAVAVGSISGIYGVRSRERRQFVRAFQSLNLSDRIVPHSRGLKKLEINQLNTLLDELDEK